MEAHLLSWIIFSPLLGILAIAFIPKEKVSLIRWTAVAATSFVGVLALFALSQFDTSVSGFQMVEKVSWIPQFNVHYLVGTDGISFPMVFLTAIMSILACVASWNIKDRHKEYFIFYLLLETGMLGTFLSLDLFLFYVFWCSGPYVFSDRYLGRTETRICRDQVFPLYPGGKPFYAAGNPRCLLFIRAAYI